MARNFYVYSQEGQGLALAWRLMCEGEKVVINCEDRVYKRCLQGLVAHVNRDPRSDEIIVCDGPSAQSQEWIDAGHYVVGGQQIQLTLPSERVDLNIYARDHYELHGWFDFTKWMTGGCFISHEAETWLVGDLGPRCDDEWVVMRFDPHGLITCYESLTTQLADAGYCGPVTVECSQEGTVMKVTLGCVEEELANQVALCASGERFGDILVACVQQEESFHVLDQSGWSASSRLSLPPYPFVSDYYLPREFEFNWRYDNNIHVWLKMGYSEQSKKWHTGPDGVVGISVGTGRDCQQAVQNCVMINDQLAEELPDLMYRFDIGSGSWWLESYHEQLVMRSEVDYPDETAQTSNLPRMDRSHDE